MKKNLDIILWQGEKQNRSCNGRLPIRSNIKDVKNMRRENSTVSDYFLVKTKVNN